MAANPLLFTMQDDMPTCLVHCLMLLADKQFSCAELESVTALIAFFQTASPLAG